jgi:hypothetical protein
MESTLIQQARFQVDACGAAGTALCGDLWGAPPTLDVAAWRPIGFAGVGMRWHPARAGDDAALLWLQKIGAGRREQGEKTMSSLGGRARHVHCQARTDALWTPDVQTHRRTVDAR